MDGAEDEELDADDEVDRLQVELRPLFSEDEQDRESNAADAAPGEADASTDEALELFRKQWKQELGRQKRALPVPKDSSHVSSGMVTPDSGSHSAKLSRNSSSQGLHCELFDRVGKLGKRG